MPACEVRVEERDGRVRITNSLVEVIYDLGAGTYRIVDRRDDSACIVEARCQAAGDSCEKTAPDGGMRRTWEAESLSGPLGAGKRLRLTTVARGTPDSLFEVELYEGKPFVALNAGVHNRLDRPIRLRAIRPLTGVAFPGLKVGENFAALDGESGCCPTRVWFGEHVKCRNNLLARFGSNPLRCLVVGGLTYHDYEKFVEVTRRPDRLEVSVWSEDPVGRLVEPGERYLPDDRFHVDLSSRDPFDALEAYAWNVRLAQNVELPTYDFPTVCLWWASQVGPPANDSPGAVREMDHIVKSGFLKYSRAGVRLLPDCYDGDNCDGWWDDAHWAKCAPTFAEPGPCYKPPYETTKKWCRAIIERGGVPIGYMRANGRSNDYARAFPGHMLFNDPNRRLKNPVSKRWWEFVPKEWPEEERNLVGYDFTDPEFLEHMRRVYGNLKDAGLAGIFFDYPKVTGWCNEGGFEDPHATTAQAYRNIFRLVHDGLGKDAYTQERAYFLGSDLSLGLVASQRTIWDNTTWAPPVISRAGLRWYKNRVIMNYDTDGKQVLDEFARNGRDGVRAMFTMSYVASARLLLANSFSQMTPEQLYDLSRVIPFHSAPRTARPVDLFSSGQYPRVYDFRVDGAWHQLTFFNTALEAGEWPSIDVNLEPFSEGRKDFPAKVRALRPAAGKVGVELGAPPAEGGLGLDPGARCYVYDFWNNRLVGLYRGNERLEQELRPCEARMMSLHVVEPHPQFLSTDRHVMQGYVDLVRRPAWNAARRALIGVSRVIGGEAYRVVIATNGRSAQDCSATGAEAQVRVLDEKTGLIELALHADQNREAPWQVVFSKG